jgi:hypothetical protein
MVDVPCSGGQWCCKNKKPCLGFDAATPARQKAQAARDDKRLFYEMKVKDWKEYDLQVYDEAYSAFGKMLDCPWFTRVWIIQELAISKKAVVQWGFHQCPGEEFMEAFMYAVEFGIPTTWNNTQTHASHVSPQSSH